MAYKIAVGSSDRMNIDLKFGEVENFLIYEVEGNSYQLLETRQVSNTDKESQVSVEEKSDACSNSGCNQGGCSGNGHGCSGPADIMNKVSIIADCRCVICKKIGFQAQKQFERKAISVFDVDSRDK